ncbi:MAG: helix-turn-helix transcriptional regulator [Hyphomicrobiales bacterium]
MECCSRSGCPISSTLDILGDKWTLVILRDMFAGKSKFSEFLASSESIATNILSKRLELIEATGLAKKTAYQQRPLRYEYRLTKKGQALLPILQEMGKWANDHVPDTWILPKDFISIAKG